MTLVFALRGAFTPHVAVTLQSIFDTNPGEEFEVIILVSDVPNQDLVKLKQMFEGRSSGFRFVPIDIGLFDGLPKLYHLDLSCYFRLVIPQIVSGKKAIYLDSDLVVTGPIRPIWETELGDNYIAVVADFCGKPHPDLPFNKEIGYCNTGVMLMNLEQWREKRVAEKVLEFSRDNPKLIRFADQCGINAIAKDHMTLLGPEYNFQGIYFESSYKRPKLYSQEQMEAARQNPTIIHFVGTIKPWHWGCKHPEKGLYWKYLKKTSFKRHYPENPTPMNILRSLAPKGVIDYFYNKKVQIKKRFK